MKDGGRLVERTCAGCGRAYMGRARRHGRFCSVACSIASVHAARRQQDSREDRPCDTCGTAFSAYRGRFCSRQCYVTRPLRSLTDRFWEKVDRKGPGECWLWMAYVHPSGYGQFGTAGAGERTYANRVAWTLTHGEIPAGLYVLHTCDVRRCVNPAHLFLGTHADNMADAKVKGRFFSGPRPHSQKLTDIECAAIVARVAAGESRRAVARALRLSSAYVGRLVLGQRRQYREAS